MVELTPVKRVDKNGVLTTKHVRADVQQKSPISVPAPAIGTPKAKYAAPAKASTVQKRWRVNKDKWGACDEELKSLYTERFKPSQTYDCSDAEAYDVMSAVSPENALPLLATGIRSASQARRFLTDEGVDHLKEDNSILADQAIARGLPAPEFIDFAGKYSGYTDLTSFFDAAECWTNTELRDADAARSKNTPSPLKPLREMILDYQIAWSDIKKIGFRTVAQRSRGADRLVNHLVRLQNGTSGFKSASEIAEVIRVGSSSIDLDIADLYGIAGYRKIDQKNRLVANDLSDALREREHSPEERFRIYEYMMKVGRTTDYRGMIALYEAGISAKKAHEGITNNLSANQIIGLHSGEVSPSISSGYL